MSGRAFAIGAFSVVTLLSQAQAAIIPLGGSSPPDPTFSPVGATLLASATIPFTAVDPSRFTGVLTSEVYRDDPFSLFGPDGLTFVFTFFNNGPDAIERFTAIDYGGFAVDAGVFVGSVGTAVPAIMDRSLDGEILGFQDFNLGLGVLAGQLSATLILHTNAPAFVPVLNNVIDGSVAVVPSFGPAVPEPVSIGALILFGGLIRKRR